MASSSNQPNTTLYVNNLNDKINKEELRSQLYALFATYGRIVEVVASKSTKMRGQAFLVFTDLASATSALRACEGMVFYDKPLHIDYAKSKSYATLKREDPNFVPPNSANASVFANGGSEKKRQRDEALTEGEREAKRDKTEEDDDDDEMEIDDDDEPAPLDPSASARLLCTNLPQEVTDDVLSVLFQEHKGFRSTNVTPSPTPNAAGEKLKVAQVTFETPQQAAAAKTALDGFVLKKGWVMSVAYN